MNLLTILYLIDLLGNFNNTIALAIVLLFVSWIFIFIIYGHAHDSDKFNKIKFFKKTKILLFFTSSIFILNIITPSQKTMYLMVSVKYLQNSMIPKKIELILNKKLDEYLLEDKKK